MTKVMGCHYCIKVLCLVSRLLHSWPACFDEASFHIGEIRVARNCGGGAAFGYHPLGI
jgi:hypothetical protein